MRARRRSAARPSAAARPRPPRARRRRDRLGRVRPRHALANSLAFLQLDLVDDEFHAHARAQAEATRDGIRTLLRAALRAGELRPCNTVRLARAVQVAYNGSLVCWAIERDGPLAARLRADLRAVLAPYRE